MTQHDPGSMEKEGDGEALLTVPIPEDAIVLDPVQGDGSPQGEVLWCRHLAIRALRKAMADRQVDLPLGPTIEPEDPGRLLVLNRFTLQLATSGLGNDVVPIDRSLWSGDQTGPQLLLAAMVDEENGVVHFPGVLTSEEVLGVLRHTQATEAGDGLELPASCFEGGIDRLLRLVRLLPTEAIARLGLRHAPGRSLLERLSQWLDDQLQSDWPVLGAPLQPIPAGVFRSVAIPAASVEDGEHTREFLLGIEADRFVQGEEARDCLETFRLVLRIPRSDTAGMLVACIRPEISGDVLPEGLRLIAVLDRQLVEAIPRADALQVEVAQEHAGDLELRLEYAEQRLTFLRL